MAQVSKDLSESKKHWNTGFLEDAKTSGEQDLVL